MSKEELIELVLRLQRPSKTSRTSSKPPASDRKERRDKAKPGGAKPGHEGHSRLMSEDFDSAVDHHPDECPCCRTTLPADLPKETISEHDTIELPAIKLFAAPPAPCRAMPLLRGAGHRGDAQGGEGNAVRPPAAYGGKPPLPRDLVDKVVALAQSEPHGETTHWTAPAMARATGISVSSVQRIWKAHAGYVASQRIRERIEKAFGWKKSVGGMRRPMLRGTDRVGWPSPC